MMITPKRNTDYVFFFSKSSKRGMQQCSEERGARIVRCFFIGHAMHMCLFARRTRCSLNTPRTLTDRERINAVLSSVSDCR